MTEFAVRDGLRYRPHPDGKEGGDLRAIRDVNRMFRKPGHVQPGDSVLDLGAHIGAFTVRALAAGASEVLAVEPMPSNIELFKLNVGDDHRVRLQEGAVTSGLVGRERLYVAKEIETDSHTMLPIRGRESIEVDTWSLAELCEEIYPTFVKVDVEGAEYDLDIPDSITPSVQRLFIEWHFKRKWHYDRAQQLRDQLLRQGFSTAWESRWGSGVWWTEGLYVR